MQSLIRLICFAALLLSLSSCSSREVDANSGNAPSADLPQSGGSAALSGSSTSDRTIVSLDGYPAFVGNEPFLELALVTGTGKSDEVFIIVGELREEISTLQGQQLVVLGYVSAAASPYVDQEIDVLSYQLKEADSKQ